MSNDSCKDIMYRILEEVDGDIAEQMIRKKEGDEYEPWETIHSPHLVAIEWQRLRNKK